MPARVNRIVCGRYLTAVPLKTVWFAMRMVTVSVLQPIAWQQK